MASVLVGSRPAPAQVTLFERLLEQDAKLVAAGFPPLSPWWLEVFERFYRSGRRQLVLRVGRRGGKSSSLSRLAVVELLHGDHKVPAGDVGMFAIVSVRRTEAVDRLRQVAKILDALGVSYEARGESLELPQLGRLFRVFTASMAGVRGPTCIGALCDEVAHWKDEKTGANPATEVLASLGPALLTQPNAKMLLSSSPLGHLDAHAAAFDAGDGPGQLTAHSPTWVANPTVTEEQTHADQPNEDKWRREYAAIPMEGTEESLFPAVLLDRATRPQPGDVSREEGVTYVAAMDPAFVRNAWTLAIAGKRMIHGRIRKSIVLAREWQGTRQRPLRPDEVLAQVAMYCRQYGITVVNSDECEEFSLRAIAERPEIDLHLAVWNTSHGVKIDRYEAMLTQLSDDTVELPKDKVVREDLINVKRALTPNGWTVRLPETPDGRHCDYASAITLALEHCREDPVGRAVLPPVGSTAYYQHEQDRLRERLEQQWERRGRADYIGPTD